MLQERCAEKASQEAKLKSGDLRKWRKQGQNNAQPNISQLSFCIDRRSKSSSTALPPSGGHLPQWLAAGCKNSCANGSRYKMWGRSQTTIICYHAANSCSVKSCASRHNCTYWVQFWLRPCGDSCCWRNIDIFMHSTFWCFSASAFYNYFSPRNALESQIRSTFIAK